MNRFLLKVWPLYVRWPLCLELYLVVMMTSLMAL